MGDGLKPPHAALVEDCCGERCGKGARDVSGGGQGDDRCERVEILKMASEPGWVPEPGMSLAGAHVLARRCPAQRRREPGLRLSWGTLEGERGYSSVACDRVAGSVPSGGIREGLSTVASFAGGPSRSSCEIPVIGVERRGRLIMEVDCDQPAAGREESR